MPSFLLQANLLAHSSLFALEFSTSHTTRSHFLHYDRIDDLVALENGRSEISITSCTRGGARDNPSSTIRVFSFSLLVAFQFSPSHRLCLGRVQEWDSFGRLRNDNLKRQERLVAIKYAQITISFVKRNSKQYISFFGATSRTNLRL